MNTNDIDWEQFDEYQKDEIWPGLEKGLDVSVYAKPEFDLYQMNEIREGLDTNRGGAQWRQSRRLNGQSGRGTR